MKAICSDAWAPGVGLSFVSTGVSKGKGRHSGNGIGMCGGSWNDRRTV